MRRAAADVLRPDPPSPLAVFPGAAPRPGVLEGDLQLAPRDVSKTSAATNSATQAAKDVAIPPAHAATVPQSAGRPPKPLPRADLAAWVHAQ